MKDIFICLSILFVTLPGFGQETITYFEAGFKTIVSKDSSRIYKPNTSLNDNLHYRPVELDVWYPSNEKTDQRLPFGHLLKLFEQRAAKYQDVKDYAGIAEEMAQQIAIESGLEAAGSEKVLHLPSDSYAGARPIAAKRPLILYFAGYNGMGFENYSLLESLAKTGYVAVSIWSVGRYPGDMTTDKLDMLEQVYDAEYAIELLRKQNELMIDFDKVGVLGCSWGGISAAVFANRNEVNAIASLDGTENYLTGEDEQEDNQVKEIFASIPLRPKAKHSSYLCLKRDGPAESEYSYFEKTKVEKYYLRLLNGRHEDFLCLTSMLKPLDSAAKRYALITQLSQAFFDAQLKGSGNFSSYYAGLDHNILVSKKTENAKLLPAKTNVINGKVIDEHSDSAVSFANVGVINKESGTVTDSIGIFTLKVSVDDPGDSIRVSMIGYKPQSYLISDLLKRKDVVISLQKDIQSLQQVEVTARKFKRRKIGNRTTSHFISTPFSYKQLGAEIGTRLNIKRAPTLVDGFNFHIAYNRLQHKAWFRLKIYEIKKGFPSINILRENILVPVDPMQTGTISVNLKPYRIVLHHDVIIALEWVKNEGEPQKGEAIFFSLGLFSKATFVRTSSQVKMKKHGSMGVGFNVDVRY